MSKRKLKRQLNLGQVVMLGASGTLAAEIFRTCSFLGIARALSRAGGDGVAATAGQDDGEGI